MAICLIIVGLISPLIPFFPFGYLFFVGLGMLGIHIMSLEKIRVWFRKKIRVLKR